MIKHLVDHSADIFKQKKINMDNKTPLFDTCRKENKAVIKYFK